MWVIVFYLAYIKNLYQIKKKLNGNKYKELIVYTLKWWKIPTSKKKKDLCFHCFIINK